MRKKHTLPQSIRLDIADTMDVVENNLGTLNYKIVPLSAIEFDPENPRQLAITREELLNTISSEDPLYEKKTEELASLQQTAETIKQYGVRNAVEIYKHGNKYRLIHGERRCLSSILAGKKDIPAKVLGEKPTDLDIRLLQYIENAQREDLTLYETLRNIKQILDEYEKSMGKGTEVDALFLAGLINRSRRHASNFIDVLNTDFRDLHEAIKEGKINSLEKAALIARSKTDKEKNLLMAACLNGSSLAELRTETTQRNKIARLSSDILLQKNSRAGRKTNKVSLGHTENRAVISKFIQLIANDPLYENFKEQLKMMQLGDFSSCSNAFKRLIKIMEKVEILS